MKPAFTYQDLNARFAGKMMRILGPRGGLLGRGVCREFVENDDVFKFVMEDGRVYFLSIDSFSQRFVQGILRMNSSCAVTIETVLSLEVATRHLKTLEEKPKNFWQSFAEELEQIIPESCKKFAASQAWNNTGVSEDWAFPTDLKNIIHLTQNRSGYECVLLGVELAKYGFENMDDAKLAFAELGEAWKGVIRIECKPVKKAAGMQIMNVWFYASEFESTRAGTSVA